MYTYIFFYFFYWSPERNVKQEVGMVAEVMYIMVTACTIIVLFVNADDTVAIGGEATIVRVVPFTCKVLAKNLFVEASIRRLNVIDLFVPTKTFVRRS
jgi:hypothetical protein